jgi:hypothetical protein
MIIPANEFHELIGQTPHPPRAKVIIQGTQTTGVAD